MSENYATNRIVTKSYLQNCERAAGTLQGGGGSGINTVSFDLGKIGSDGMFTNVSEDTKTAILKLITENVILYAKLQFEPIGFVSQSPTVLKQFKDSEKQIGLIIGTAESPYLIVSTDLQTTAIIGGGELNTYTTSDFVLTLYYL